MSAADDEASFDPHVDDYDEQLQRGLRASGESKEFFARGRVEHVRSWWFRRTDDPPARVVDFGCGIGDGAVALAAAFPNAEVVGVDVSRRSVRRARELHADAARLRFEALQEFEVNEPGAADLVHVNGVLHHVPPVERAALFARLAGLLRPGGVAAVFENNAWNPGTRWVMSRIPFDRDAVTLTPGEVRRGLEQAGLRPRDTSSLFWFPRALSPLRPLERYLAWIPLGAQYGVIAVAPGGEE